MSTSSSRFVDTPLPENCPMLRLRVVFVLAFAGVSLALVSARTPGLLPLAPLVPDVPKEKKDAPPPRVPLPKGHELMAAKLKESQAVLEGIALGDFQQIEKASLALSRISQAAEFLNAGKSKEYELEINLFRRASDRLNRKAKDKNIDGVMLAFQDMTMTCLKCHQHTRDNKPDARLPLDRNFAGK